MLDSSGKCDMKCPPLDNGNPVSCCNRKNCENLNADGCILGERKPEHCKEYDCKDYIYFVTYKFDGIAWREDMLLELNIKTECDRDFVEKHNKLVSDKVKQLYEKGINNV